MMTFLRQVLSRYKIQAMISIEDLRDYYHEAFFDSFRKDQYKKVIPKLVALFKSLNNGKPTSTVIVDFKGSITPLKPVDLKMIEALKLLDYQTNEEMYSSGFVEKEGKRIPVLDILKTRASKIRGLDKLKKEYEKNKNEKVKKLIEFYEEVIGLELLDKEGKIDISKLAIHENNANKAKMVFSYKLRAIASQSTEVGWTSCQDLQKHKSLRERDYYDDRYREDDGDDDEEGRYVHYVGAGASDGVFICYLVKAGNEYTLDRPTARVLFKPYFGQLTGDIIWKPDKIYGTAPESFRTMAQTIIDKVIHPKQDIYVLTQNTYVDQPLRDQKVIHNIDWTKLSQIQLGKIVFNPKSHGKTKELAISHLRDQIVLTKLVKDTERFDLPDLIWEHAFDKIKSQRTVVDICLNDGNWRRRIYALKRVDNPQILEKIILGTETDIDIKAEALIKLGNKKPEIFDKIVEDKAQKSEFRTDVMKTAHIDPKILEKILYDEEDSFKVRKAAVENGTEKMLKDLVESKADIRLRHQALYSITPKILEEFVLNKNLEFELRVDALQSEKIAKEDKRILYKKIMLDKEEDPEMQMSAIEEMENPEHKDLKSLAIQTTSIKVKWKVLDTMVVSELLSKDDGPWLADVLCEINEADLLQHSGYRYDSKVKMLLGFITEDKIFTEMMNKMKNWGIIGKNIVLENIKDNDILYKIIMDEKNPIGMREMASMNPHFQDEKYLQEIASSDLDPQILNPIKRKLYENKRKKDAA